MSFSILENNEPRGGGGLNAAANIRWQFHGPYVDYGTVVGSE